MKVNNGSSRSIARKFRDWVIMKILRGKPFMANIHLISTVAINTDLTKDGSFINITVNLDHSGKIPKCSFFMWSKKQDTKLAL